MTYKRRHPAPLRPWALWFALFIAWVGAIVPTVSHAVAWSHQGDPSYVAICTTQGPRADNAADTVAAADGLVNDAADGAKKQGVALSMAHCPFCLHATDRSAPAPEPLAFSFLPKAQLRDVAVGQGTHYLSPFYAKAAPRGPPAFS